MQDKINDADRCQDVDKFCPPRQPERRIDTDGQGSGFFRPFLIMYSRFDEEFIFSRGNVAESDIVTFIDGVPRVFESFQHINILYLIDERIVLDVEPHSEAILCMTQFNVLSLGEIDNHIIVFWITQPSQYFHLCDNRCRGRLFIHGNVRIETTYSIDRTEINLSILALCYTTT